MPGHSPVKGQRRQSAPPTDTEARRSPVRMTRLTGLQEVGMKKRRLNFIPITSFISNYCATFEMILRKVLHSTQVLQ